MLFHQRILDGGVVYDQGGTGAAAAAGQQGQQGQGAPGSQSGAGGGNTALDLAMKIVSDAEAAKAAGQGQQGQGQQGQGQQGQGQGTPYVPDGLPDHLKGASEKEIIDKLWGAYKPARDTIAQRGEVPKSADAYQIQISDAQKQLFSGDDLTKDPAVKVWAKVAHEAGLTHKEFNLFGRFFEEMAKAGLTEPKIDPKAEIGRLGEDIKATEPDAAKREAEGARRIVNANTWLQGLETRKHITQQERQVLSGLTTTAAGVRIIEKLAKLGQGTGVQNAAGGASGVGDTKESLDTAMMDDRYSSTSPKFDAGYRRDVDERYRRWHAANAGRLPGS